MNYVPVRALEGRPCIVVDSGPRPEALITLSHWPGSGTPADLQADLSTQIVFRYLDQPAFHVKANVATSDHFDEDGLASLFAVTSPEQALARRELVCDFASAGDFGTCQTREAARCAFVVSAYADPERSPLGQRFFELPEDDRVERLFSELLDRLPELLDHPERYASLWQDEEQVFLATESALKKGTIRIEEVPALDMAIVHLPENALRSRVHRFAQVRQLEYHPMAIYNATKRLRILYMRGMHYEFEYRYESWVQFMSRRPLPRVDLSPLAVQLTEVESSLSTGETPVWMFEGATALTPRLYLSNSGQSKISPERFRQTLEAFLASAPPAWNPYVKGDR